jgi:hypothetical protein
VRLRGARLRGFRAGVLAVLLLSSAACRPQTWIDGYPIGDAIDCSDGQCARFTDFAAQTLDRARPGHPVIVSVQVYLPDFRGPDGELLLAARSGGSDHVVVLTLADGTVEALYVGCGVGIDPDRCFIGSGPGSGPIDLRTR